MIAFSPVFRRKASNSSWLSMMLAVSFLLVVYQIEEVPSIPTLLKVFIMKEGWIL